MKIIYIGEFLKPPLKKSKGITVLQAQTINDFIVNEAFKAKNILVDLNSSDYVVVDMLNKSDLNANHFKSNLKTLIDFLKRNVQEHKLILHNLKYTEKDYPEYFERVIKNLKLKETCDYFLANLNWDISTFLINKEKVSPDEFYQVFYDNYDKIQEYYKLNLWHEDFIRKPWDSSLDFYGSYMVRFRIKREISWHQVAFWSDYTHPISKKKYVRMPQLKNESVYDISPKFVANDFDWKIRFIFYDNSDKQVYSKVLDASDYKLKTPSKYKYYRIGLILNGKGECEFEYISIRRSKVTGILSPEDKKMYFKDSEPVIYNFRKKENAKHLIVVFNGIKIAGPRYDFVATFRDTKAHYLNILDDYGLTGSYYLDRNKGTNLQKNIISIIESYQKEYNISSNRTIMLGNSKGGFAAIYYGLAMGINHILASGPTLKLGQRLKGGSKFALSALHYIVNEPTDENIDYLDNILYNAIKNNSTSSKINFLLVEKDPLTSPYLSEFLKRLDTTSLEYDIDMREGEKHEDLLKYLKEWSLSKVNKILQM